MINMPDGPWYHEILLPDGTVTPGWTALRQIWDQIRQVRIGLDYAGQGVLDIGSRDGMWAFEAERKGASRVVATDIGDTKYYEHILWLRGVLQSKILPYYNISTEFMSEGLEWFFKWEPQRFDIIQHLGVLYHLRNPLLSLSECRKCIRKGGKLLLETATCNSDKLVARFNSDSGIYDDKETYWAFSLSTLVDALSLCGFEFDRYNVRSLKQTEEISRTCLIATAV